MPENTCTACGLTSPLSYRFCPKCGTSLYDELDPPQATPDSFIPLLNSLYNLLAVRDGKLRHADRQRYFPAPSEEVIIRRCRIEHRIDLSQLLPYDLYQQTEDESLMGLYKFSLSTSLAGYAYRSVEEMIYKDKPGPLSEAQKQDLLSVLYREGGDDISGSEYRTLSPADRVDSRLLLCLAIRWNSGYKNYLLADDSQHEEWWGIVVSKNTEEAMERYRQVYTSLGAMSSGLPGSELEDLAIDHVEQDLIHGYIVKLLESLAPL